MLLLRLLEKSQLLLAVTAQEVTARLALVTAKEISKQ